MSSVQVSESPARTEAQCPVDHSAYSAHNSAHNGKSQQKTAHPPETSTVPVEQDEQGVWHVRGFVEARAVLRNPNTKQAGFHSEQMTNIPSITNRPILFQEGKVHQQQRKQTARFFAPKTVTTEYRELMESLADQLVAKFKEQRHGDLSQITLRLAVTIASQVVGLTNSRLPGMDKRINAFLENSEPKALWKPLARLLGSLNNLRMMAFFFLDVKPAINARKHKPQEDVISHLLGLNYSDPEILIECVTYAAAGMVTTREFISMATWHFLENPELRARFLVAGQEERYAMLHEVLRLEPIVGHLFRRATADITLNSGDQVITIPQGALIDLHVYANNADETVVGEAPLALCPGRELHGDHVPAMLMSFGDGHHRCPGEFMAIQETDIFLSRLLALDTLRIEKLPTLSWIEVAAAYEVRDFQVTLD